MNYWNWMDLTLPSTTPEKFLDIFLLLSFLIFYFLYYSFNFHLYNLPLPCKKRPYFKANFIYIHTYIYYNFCDWFCFVLLMLYFWESNLYSRFLIFAFWYLLSILYFKILTFTTRFYLGVWLLAWFPSPLLTLPFLLRVTTISFLLLLFPV